MSLIDRFELIVITSARSGTHMLCTALETVGYKCADELLRPDLFVDTRKKGFQQRYKEVIKTEWRPALNRAADVGFHGFPVFRGGVHGPDDFWNQVRNSNSDMILIQLHRQDLLALALSRKIAAKTKVWQSRKEVEPHDFQVEIEPGWYAQHCEKYLKDIRDMSIFLDGRTVLNVAYEHLCESPEYFASVLSAVCGHPVEKAEPKTFKQEKRPVSDVVSNYDQLYSMFHGTPYWYNPTEIPEVRPNFFSSEVQRRGGKILVEGAS